MTRETARLPVLGPGAELAGRYLLRQVLGRGGSGTVFAATDRTLRRDVAVKVFSHHAGDPDHDRIDAEARTLAALSHPGLVTVFDAGTVVTGAVGDELPFLVTELVDGPTLADRLGDGPLRPAEVTALGADLAETLAYVHGRGVVHRDVKPANILLAPGPAGFTPKLSDFGIARLLGAPRRTEHGMTLGTAAYLSPEQARGDEVGLPTDVYALGLVLIECLTGRPAFPGSGLEAAVQRLHRAPAVPGDLDPRLGGLLTAMTAADPGRRPTAGEVAATLRALAPTGASAVATPTGTADQVTTVLPVASGGSSTALLPAAGASTPVPPRTAGWRARRRGRRMLAPAVGAAVALILVVMIAVLASSRGGRPSPKPEYPAVTGRLGTDLQRLEQVVP